MTKRLFGLDPVPLPPHVFALDGHSLRYGRFVREGNQAVLDAYQVADVESDLFASGPLGGSMHDPEVLRSLLTSLQESQAEPITEASLVLPDAWLRLAFVEAEDLPRSSSAQEEILRWKLQRIVPFRVEELRVEGIGAAEIPNNGSLRRLLIGFALEGLLSQLESAFAARGIRLGLVTNESLSCLSAARHALSDVELGAVVLVGKTGYSLIFVLRGEPILQRFKALPQLADDEPSAHLVQRDLRLTELFLREQLTDKSLGRVLLVSPPEIEDRWLGWLAEAFEQPAHAMRAQHLALSVETSSPPINELGPLFGVARMEIQ
ncbi:MAG: hypothetical protein P8Y44_07030 [Acidobacteriota bacterium]